MNGLALCAGVGGLELGLHLALEKRYKTVCYCEREGFAASTLVARMEDKALDRAPIWDDLKTFRGAAWRGRVDIISGGYPCQPFSVAGKRLGELDERHLWPDVARIVGEVQPRFCFFENVAGHLRMGYADVRRDLRELGYRVEAGIFSATELGAPHRRERLFILAMADGSSKRRQQVTRSTLVDEVPNEGRSSQTDNQPKCCGKSVGNAHGFGRRIKSNESIASENASTSGAGMEDAACKRGQRGHLPVRSRRQDESKNDFDRTKPGMEHAKHSGRDAGQTGTGRQEEPTAGHAAAFPPGPGDADAWATIIADSPVSAPSISDAEAKSLFRGMVDVLAFRLDRLRCCGNGVVPVVAAKAFVCLAARLISGSEKDELTELCGPKIDPRGGIGNAE